MYGMDWLAAILILLAIYLLGDKNPLGHLCGAVGSLIGIFISASLGLWGYTFMEIVLVVLYYRGWVNS